jgi:hypothetical protein
MTYQTPVKETEYASVSVHNNPELSPGSAWIVSDRQKRSTLAFFKDAPLAALKDVFTAVANLKDDGEGKFILFHAVNPGDKTQNTNSKLPSLHIHTFTGPFAAAFSHISDPRIKSYVVQPNVSLTDTIKAAAPAGENVFKTVSLSKHQGGEIESHTILMHTGFRSFDDFTKKASRNNWEDFRKNMVSLIEPWVQAGKGGARIVIDDRYTRSGCLTVQILAGENMDRSGNDEQRYFERPGLRIQ